MKFQTSENRIYGLDLLRAIAIIIVVIGHSGFILENTFLEGFPYFNLIDGVDLFFVLSGFLIGSILLKEINKSDQISLKQLFGFWKRRWFRTLPNYYLILFFNYLVVRFGIINEDIDQFNVKFLFFLQNFSSPFYGFFWESWSLSIEEWFYIITPVLIYFISKKTSYKKTFLISTVLMILLPIIYRIFIFDDNIDSFWWGVTFRKTVLCRLDSIGYGLLAAWIYYYHPMFWEKVKIPSFTFGIIIMVFIINYRQEPNTFYKQIVYLSLTSISVLLILPLIHSYKESSGIFAAITTHVSKISYSMYLINLGLIAEVIRDNFAPQGGIDGVVKFLLFWFILVFVSTLLYKYFEKPIINLRDYKNKF